MTVSPLFRRGLADFVSSARNAGVAPGPDFHPLIVNDHQATRHLIWSSCDHGVALLPDGEPPQLFETFMAVCDALRVDTRREPQFDALNDIRHRSRALAPWTFTCPIDAKARQLLVNGS